MKIQWMKPEDAANSLRGELDESGAADGCVVRLDASSEHHDGGPYLRQAWYDSTQDGFVCAATARLLPNVQAWAYDFFDDDEARRESGLTAQSPYVSQPQPPKIQPAVWDGTIRFDSDCIVNGVEIKAGTVWRAGEQFISTEK